MGVSAPAREIAIFADQILEKDSAAENGWILEFWDWILEVEEYGYLSRRTDQFFRTEVELECYGQLLLALNEVERQGGSDNSFLRVSDETAYTLKRCSMDLYRLLSDGENFAPK